MAKGLGRAAASELATEVARELERLKLFLWHATSFAPSRHRRSWARAAELLKPVGEIAGYIRANATWIPNYGERYRQGEAISNAFVESTVNQVVSKRMVKKQQMRWAPRGCHLPLQVRRCVLNDDLVSCLRGSQAKSLDGGTPVPRPQFLDRTPLGASNAQAGQATPTGNPARLVLPHSLLSSGRLRWGRWAIGKEGWLGPPEPHSR